MLTIIELKNEYSEKFFEVRARVEENLKKMPTIALVTLSKHYKTSDFYEVVDELTAGTVREWVKMQND